MTTSHIYLLISITICIICILPLMWLPVYKAEPDDYEIDVDDIVTVHETPDADEFMKQRVVLLHTDEVGLVSAFNRIWLFDDHIELVDDDGERFHIQSTTVSNILFATFDDEQ